MGRLIQKLNDINRSVGIAIGSLGVGIDALVSVPPKRSVASNLPPTFSPL